MREFYRQRGGGATQRTKAEAMQRAQLALLRGEVRVTTDEQAQQEQLRRTDTPRTGGSTTAGQQSFRFNPQAPYAHPYYWAPFILIGNWR